MPWVTVQSFSDVLPDKKDEPCLRLRALQGSPRRRAAQAERYLRVTCLSHEILDNHLALVRVQLDKGRMILLDRALLDIFKPAVVYLCQVRILAAEGPLYVLDCAGSNPSWTTALWRKQAIGQGLEKAYLI